MKNDLFNTEIDEIIRASMKLADEPDPELNNKLKATLYQKETAMRKHAGRCSTNSNQQHLFILLCCWYLFLHWTGRRFAYHRWC